MTDPTLFIAAVLILLSTPGPTNTLLATSGATLGVSRSLSLLVGELTGYLVAITAVRVVLGPIIQAHPWVGVALKIAVVTYLGWVAVRLWREKAALTDAGTVSARSVFITTLLNPKSLFSRSASFRQSTLPWPCTSLHSRSPCRAWACAGLWWGGPWALPLANNMAVSSAGWHRWHWSGLPD